MLPPESEGLGHLETAGLVRVVAAFEEWKITSECRSSSHSSDERLTDCRRHPSVSTHGNKVSKWYECRTFISGKRSTSVNTSRICRRAVKSCPPSSARVCSKGSMLQHPFPSPVKAQPPPCPKAAARPADVPAEPASPLAAMPPVSPPAALICERWLFVFSTLVYLPFRESIIFFGSGEGDPLEQIPGYGPDWNWPWWIHRSTGAASSCCQWSGKPCCCDRATPRVTGEGLQISAANAKDVSW